MRQMLYKGRSCNPVQMCVATYIVCSRTCPQKTITKELKCLMLNLQPTLMGDELSYNGSLCMIDSLIKLT